MLKDMYRYTAKFRILHIICTSFNTSFNTSYIVLYTGLHVKHHVKL
jgi:hypothetical protein